MLVAFSVTPIGVGEGVGEIVAEAVRVVRDSGLPNKTDSMFTVIEGETWEEVMAVVQRAVEAVAARAPRVSTVIKADWRAGASDAMTQKVATVERYLVRCRAVSPCTASRNACSAASPWTANTILSSEPGWCCRTASTISRAASSSGKPPTPVPKATSASERQPSSSALRSVEAGGPRDDLGRGRTAQLHRRRVDHVASRHVAGRGLDRLPEADRCLLGRFPLHVGPTGAGDRRGDTAAVP